MAFPVQIMRGLKVSTHHDIRQNQAGQGRPSERAGRDPCPALVGDSTRTQYGEGRIEHRRRNGRHSGYRL